MKRKILFLLPSIFLIFISAYIFVAGWAAATEGYDLKPTAIAFTLSIFLNFLYNLWLRFTKRIEITSLQLYVSIIIIFFIIFIFLIINPPYEKEIYLNIGEDPFAPGTTIGSFTTVYFWQKGFFYSEQTMKELEAERKAEMQITRQGSLIGHVGVDLRGWSTEKIKTAFGEPAKIMQVDESLEKWIYHPWTNHPDWEMPVYVQNNALVKIGD